MDALKVRIFGKLLIVVLAMIVEVKVVKHALGAGESSSWIAAIAVAVVLLFNLAQAIRLINKSYESAR